MGIAAATKRQPGQKRWLPTTNPWTGKREWFKTSISYRGFREWEVDRIDLASQGYPDYPPVYDDPILRSWDPSTAELAVRSDMTDH